MSESADPPEGGCVETDVRPLSECFDSVDSEGGRRRVAGFLREQPYPHYEPAPGAPGLLVRVDEDGTRITGRFVGRAFRPAEPPISADRRREPL